MGDSKAINLNLSSYQLIFQSLKQFQLNPLSTNLTKWSNTFDHIVGLPFKGLTFCLEICDLRQLPKKTRSSILIWHYFDCPVVFFHLVHSKKGCPVTKSMG